MSNLASTVRVDPDTLDNMADSIDKHAAHIEDRIHHTSATLDDLTHKGGFEGLAATALLWTYQQQRPTFEMWAKRLRAYALRIRLASQAIRMADVSSTNTVSKVSDSYGQLQGIERDAQYKTLLELEQQLKELAVSKNGIAVSLMSLRARLAEADARLADYDEVSGNNLGEYVEDLREYVGVRLSGDRNALENEIGLLHQSIAEQETALTAANNRIQQITTNIELTSQSIHSRIQDVGGGQQVLFHQQMAPKPIAEPGWCLKFVVDWRPDINAGFGSAANLITTNHESVAPYRYRIDSMGALSDHVLPGDLVVWNRGQQGADAQHGHVAMVMEAHDDFIIVKESSWENAVDTWRRIPRSSAQELVFVGQP